MICGTIQTKVSVTAAKKWQSKYMTWAMEDMFTRVAALTACLSPCAELRSRNVPPIQRSRVMPVGEDVWMIKRDHKYFTDNHLVVIRTALVCKLLGDAMLFVLKGQFDIMWNDDFFYSFFFQWYICTIWQCTFVSTGKGFRSDGEAISKMLGSGLMYCRG